MKTILTLCVFILCITQVQAKQQAVAMPDKFSAEAANQVMLDGGNAVDAAIAAQFVLAVTYPEAGNIGGGGFMLVYKDNKAEFLDYREKAPAKAHRDMYLDKNGDVIPNLSVYGILASGVPGTVSGMWEAHQAHGTLPWKRLVQPAVDLAEKGFIVPAKLAGRISRYSKWTTEKDLKVNFAEHFAHAKSGKLFVQSALAETLKRIRDKGMGGFYSGKTADQIVEFMQQKGGLISHKDLKAYKAVWRKPLAEKWRDMTVLSAPPPSSGGIAIIQWLKMYDMIKPAKVSLEHNSQAYMHLLSEVGKRVFADRAEYLGDPDFYKVPVAQLTDPEYLLKRASGINMSAISETEKVPPGLYESEQTTHFSIVDKWGNAVANTTTLNLSFGSGMVVDSAGFLLNDEMDDFSIKAGVANAFGALGGVANEIQPHKRMLSSMTPSMLLENGKVKLVTGSPGGTTIITSVYQSILNVIDFGMSAQQATDAPRFHHQLWPKNVIRHHKGIDKATLKALADMGYTVSERRFGDLHVITQQQGKLDAGSEQNGRGKAMVVDVD